MNFKDNILFYCILHLLMGYIAHTIPAIVLIYPVIIFAIGLILVVKNKNKDNESLYVASYIVGSELLIRMSGNYFFFETGKYGVIFFMILGLLYNGFSKKSFIYAFILLLFVPGIIVALIQFSDTVNIRKAIIFNILGPVCLIISAIYCYDKEIKFSQLQTLLLSIGLPIIAALVYVVLYIPITQDVFVNTGSNFNTSGGFGPNQVSTIFGLAFFIFFSLFLFFSKSILHSIIYILLSVFFAYRTLLTFSRGGFYTALIMVLVLLVVSYFKINIAGKIKIKLLLIVLFFSGIFLFGYATIQTNGLISNRYANQDALGREKESKFSGREDIAESEIKVFLNNPVFGVGIGRSKEAKEKFLGAETATHNEVTRLLAEQGVFGLIIFFILFFAPLIYYFNQSHQIFFFAFFIFWLLTINHAAIRLAAPAFIYALSLVKITFDET